MVRSVCCRFTHVKTSAYHIWLQMINSGLFQKFDFGSSKANMKAYNQVRQCRKRITIALFITSKPTGWSKVLIFRIFTIITDDTSAVSC